MEQKFNCVQDVQSHKTPGTPKFLIVIPMVDNKKISTGDQQEYLSGVGMLLYLVKHLCPDLAHATWELSKANDGPNLAAYKELLHVIKYVLDAKNLRLMNPGKSSVLVIATMQETR